MPLGLKPLEFAEITLLAAGALLIIGGAALLALRGRLKVVLHLPTLPEHHFEPADLLIGLMALWILPSLFLKLFVLLGASPPPAMPDATASTETMPVAAVMLAATAGRIATVAVLLALGTARVRGGLRGWGLGRDLVPKHALPAVLAYIAVWPACAGLLNLARILILIVAPSYSLPEHGTILTLRSADTPTWMTVLSILTASVLAPVVEELFFRGLLQQALAKWLGTPWRAVLVSACVFGAFHGQVVDTVPALVFFGLVLGYAYAKTGSLMLVIMLHMVFNAKTILWIVLEPLLE